MDESIRTAAISPLRQRLIDDMSVRRFSRETQRNYIRDVGRFAIFLGRSPDTATADDVRRFQIEQRDAGMPTPTMNSIVSALRFFFTHTIDRPDLTRKLIRGAAPRDLRRVAATPPSRIHPRIGLSEVYFSSGGIERSDVCPSSDAALVHLAAGGCAAPRRLEAWLSPPFSYQSSQITRAYRPWVCVSPSERCWF
jgi:hypothetical protein